MPKRTLYIATAVYWLFIFTMTHIPQGQGPSLPVNDKIEHFGAYGLLAGAVFLCLWVRKPRSWSLAWQTPLITIAYGAIDEWIQAIPFIHRSCELNDWFADVIGTFIAVAILCLVKWIMERQTIATAVN